MPLSPSASDPAAAQEPLQLQVVSIRTIAEGCKLFELARHDGAPLPGCKAGAHIGIQLPNGLHRQYSLIDQGDELASYRFAVKRDAASRGGSAYLCEQVEEGHGFFVDPPRNNFPLDEDAPHSLLIAGGIGITPIRSMIDRLEELGHEWTLHAAARSRAEAPFHDMLSAFPQARFHFDDEQGRVLDVASIVAAAPAGSHIYCCGPAPMLSAFEQAVSDHGVEPDRVHVEYFTQKFESATDGGFIVELARSGGEVRVEPGQTILEALREAGLDMASSCEEGICGACETRVISGVPDHRDAILSERERKENKTMFICCSGAKSERLVLDV